jgi:2-iminoacetate synthase
MTLQEYLLDYAAAETRQRGEAIIHAEMNNIPGEKVRRIVEDNLAGIHRGRRDFRL